MKVPPSIIKQGPEAYYKYVQEHINQPDAIIDPLPITRVDGVDDRITNEMIAKNPVVGRYSTKCWVPIYTPQISDFNAQIWELSYSPLVNAPNGSCDQIRLAEEYAFRTSGYKGVTGYNIAALAQKDVSNDAEQFFLNHAINCPFCWNKMIGICSQYSEIEKKRNTTWTKEWWSQKAKDTLVSLFILSKVT